MHGPRYRSPNNPNTGNIPDSRPPPPVALSRVPLPRPPTGGGHHHSSGSISSMMSAFNGSTSEGRSTPGNDRSNILGAFEISEQAVIHTYNLTVRQINVQFIISVHLSEDNKGNEYRLTLTYIAGGIERSIGSQELLTLSMDPDNLEFKIFVFPKPSIPANSLFCVRVWLEGTDGAQHRLWSDDNLWLSQDIPFHTIENIALTQLAPFPSVVTQTSILRVYKGYVGRAACDFIVSMEKESPMESIYTITLEYEAGGIRRKLFDDVRVRMHCRVDEISFVIYTVPVASSSLPYSNHMLRVWIRGQNRVVHRIWKTDQLRVGANINFDAFGRDPRSGVVFAQKGPNPRRVARYTPLIPFTKGRSETQDNNNNTSQTNINTTLADDFPPGYNESIGLR